EKSYKLDPRPGTLFTLAECEAKRGRLATAVKHYDDYLALHAQLSESQRRRQGERAQIARAQRAMLLPLVPGLTMVLPPDAPRGTIVTLDGAVVAPSALGAELPVDPGEHVVTTQAPGGPVDSARVSVANGQKKAAMLQVRAGSAPGADGEPVPGAPRWQRPV